jgi:hypothetical protein
LGHDASPIVRRSKMPRYIKDSTMSIYIDGLKNGTRYRESGLVLVVIAAIRLSKIDRRLSDQTV